MFRQAGVMFGCNLAPVTVVYPYCLSQSCQFTKANKQAWLARYIFVGTQFCYRKNILKNGMSWLHSIGVFRVISLYWISLCGLETSWSVWLFEWDLITVERLFWSRYDIPSVLLLFGTYCSTDENSRLFISTSTLSCFLSFHSRS